MILVHIDETEKVGDIWPQGVEGAFNDTGIRSPLGCDEDRTVTPYTRNEGRRLLPATLDLRTIPPDDLGVGVGDVMPKNLHHRIRI